MESLVHALKSITPRKILPQWSKRLKIFQIIALHLSIILISWKKYVSQCRKFIFQYTEIEVNHLPQNPLVVLASE